MGPLSLFLARPLGLLALALPLAVLLLARRVRHPEGAATGTLSVWREVAGDAPPRGGRARLRLTPGLALLVAALVLGALALAKPRIGPRTPAREVPSWRIVLDRSPSMYLDGRQERALAAALAWLERSGGAREWASWDGAALVLERGDAPPAAWTRAPPVPRPEPPWTALDQDGTLWVTDADRPSQRAGVFAGGGEAVPGPAAVGESALLVWDGEALTESLRPLPRRTLIVDAGVPTQVAQLAALWARERGLALSDAVDDVTALHVARASSAGGREVAAGRDGWSATGPAGSARLEDPPHPRPRVWLEADTRPLVTWRAGRVEVAWSRLDEVGGDPAAFAVSWSRLLDDALAPPRGVVPIAERAVAGAAAARAPAAVARATNDAHGALDAGLAALAALLALAALFART